MGTQINPLLLSLVPGSNPTGSNLSTPAPPVPGGNANPYLMNTNTSASAPVNPDPYAGGAVPGGATRRPADMPAGVQPVSTLPTIGTAPAGTGTFTGGGVTGTYGGGGGPLGLGETTKGLQTLQNNLSGIFGRGVGDALTQFLSSGAGYSPQILQQLFAQLQPQFAQQQEQLLNQFSAAGGRFSSGAELGLSNLLGQQSLTEGDIAAQLYEQAVQNYMNVLTGTQNPAAKKASSQQNVLQSLFSLIGPAAGAVETGLKGIGGGGGGVGAVLGGLAAL